MKAKAIVFGTGNYYKTKKASIEEKYDIIGFVDSAVRVDETRIIDGKVIKNPSRIKEYDEAYIILCSVKHLEMWECLIKYRIPSSRILFGTDFSPAYDELEEFLDQNNGRLACVDGTVILSLKEETLQIRNQSDLNETFRKLFSVHKLDVQMVRQLSCYPVSRRFGYEHGRPIDRYYIDQFIEKNSAKICGTVAEIAEDRYSKKYRENIDKNLIMHVDGWGENVIKANLATGEGIRTNIADCFICTQTIQFIYNMQNVVENMFRFLKPGGCALVTAHGISPISLYDYRNWGEYWRYTDKALFNLFSSVFGEENVEVNTFGNVKIATAFLYGLAIEDMDLKDFEYNDKQFQLVITVLAKKGKQI